MKKVLLGAKYSIIEPLGLLHLSRVARQEGWDSKIVLVEKDDFSKLEKVIKEYRPSVVGYTIYTGNHLQTFSYFDKLKARYRDIKTIFGGPHATYFPQESARHADYVVLSEGFSSFRKILREEVKPGIIHLTGQEPFPASDRESFYKDYTKYRDNPIKSIITQTGCPYSCTYCYNSSSLEDIASVLSNQQVGEMRKVLHPLGRLFPRSLRSVDEVINEISIIKEISPKTQMIYIQDDVFVGVGNKWIREFHKKFPVFGLSFHAQVRFDYADPKNLKSRERLELMREAGCTGLTIAIESASPIIRKEVLNRPMKEDLMFRVFEYLNKLGYKVRTEQMLGLPYGATQQQTKVNLEADLETLELNVRLKEATGLPTMAWASIFAPYRGTKIGEYCRHHGFYLGGNNDVPETFFDRSVLNFPKKWTGISLSKDKKEYWLEEQEQEIYKDKLQLLRDLFNIFAMVPKGNELAKNFLEQEDKSYFGLSTATRRHLYDSVLYEIE